jgi:hypothetical protein
LDMQWVALFTNACMADLWLVKAGCFCASE